MAKRIDKGVVTAGRLLRVWNEKRAKFSNAARLYFAVWVENNKGGNEECLLFTEKEIERARYRASRNREDLPKKGFLADIFD